MVIIEATFHEQNKKLHVLGKTLTVASAISAATPVLCNFLFGDGDLSLFFWILDSVLRIAVIAIRPDKFIFDTARDTSILHSIRGTLFLIWNTKECPPRWRNARRPAVPAPAATACFPSGLESQEIKWSSKR
ncbi:hypothetical protein [Burkholderia ambifaria]|uniref:hypothetical protein n=1 Tax=Burkholderia ambifaria TaxID=152480 RepID=UPI001B9C9E79|nr:hypothetical protein [Burkholderia ambifaria]MBR8221021.1 hypothetical protein [Burkholderia ambifaria]